jgi:hypothetical protein
MRRIANREFIPFHAALKSSKRCARTASAKPFSANPDTASARGAFAGRASVF